MAGYLNIMVTTAFLGLAYCSVSEHLWKKARKLTLTDILHMKKENIAGLNITQVSASQVPSEGGATDLAVKTAFGDFDFEDPDDNAIYEAHTFHTVCSPRERGVRAPQPTVTGVLHWPEYVRLERCSDCCPHNQECSPVTTYKKRVTLLMLKATKDNEPQDFHIIGHIRVAMDAHVDCECRCKVNESSCNARQTYNKHTCLCSCKVQEKCPDHKTWNDSTCSCVCPQMACPHQDEVLNQELCRCELQPSVTQARKDDSITRLLPQLRGSKNKDSYHRDQEVNNVVKRCRQKRVCSRPLWGQSRCHYKTVCQ